MACEPATGGAFMMKEDRIRCRPGDQRRAKHPHQLIREIYMILQDSYELR